MAATISAFPRVPLLTDVPEVFDPDAVTLNLFLANTFQPQINTLSTEVETNAGIAETGATDAQAALATTVTARDTTLGYRDETEVFRDEAQAAVASLPEGTINDTVIATDSAWSSSKIDGELQLKADLVGGKVPAEQLPASAGGLDIGQIVLSSAFVSFPGFLRLDGSTVLTSAYPELATWAAENFADEFLLFNFTSETSGTTEQLNDITHDGVEYVAVGNNGKIITSPDRVNWTTQTSGVTANLLGASFANGVLFATGATGQILTSTDRVNWTARTSGITDQIRKVAHNGSLYVAVGGGGTILTSPDLVTWTPQTSGTTNLLTDIIYKGTRLIAVGASGTVVTSDNTTAWDVRSTGVTDLLWGVDSSDNTIVAVGASGRIISSIDEGVAWTTQASGSAETLNDVKYNGYRFAVCGNNGEYLLSADVSSWVSKDSGTASSLFGIEVIGDNAVAVGAGGIVLNVESDEILLASVTGINFSGYIKAES